MIDDTIKKDAAVETVESAVTAKNAEPEVVNVDLGFVEKRKFSIGGDFSRILELNVSDLNIAARLKEGYPKLQALLKEAQEKVTSIPDTDDELEDLGKLADTLTEIDKKMRDIIDFIFDTNASEVCAPSGNMYDPVGGQWRFERIIEILSSLYTNGLNAEFKQLKNRVEGKAIKYIKPKKSKK